MNEEISKKAHAIRGSLSVVMGFVRLVDKEELSPTRQELYEACKANLDKILLNVDEIQQIAARHSR